MAEVVEESWRPPLFAKPSVSLIPRLIARLRRFADLQAGSAWRDLSILLPQVRGTVLDVGCGSQPFRPLVNSEATYIGIDTEFAREHFGYEIPDTIYFTGDCWPISDSSIDCVLCTETMEHVFDVRRFLREVVRCLKGGGTLLLTVPFAARWHFIPYDYWRFTPSCLDAILREVGFSKIQVCARGNAGTVACYKIMALVLSLLSRNDRVLIMTYIMRAIGILLLPCLLGLAFVANLTLLGNGGDDCLGYTIIATL
jgi:SAM-dependent methyltransferase